MESEIEERQHCLINLVRIEFHGPSFNKSNSLLL